MCLRLSCAPEPMECKSWAESCVQAEMSNQHDSYAVTVMYGEETACHITCDEISAESGPLGLRRWPLVG